MKRRNEWLSRHAAFDRMVAAVPAVLLLVVVFAPLRAEAPFDPKAVQSRECQGGQMKCGYTPPGEDVDQAVPLADSTMISHRGLASSADLSSDMPPVMNQGQQNSCVAFSVAYYTRSYLEKKKRGWNYDAPVAGGQGERVFSPAFVYNQINGGKDNGSYFNQALDLVTARGAAPWKAMPYSPSDYRTQPSRQALDAAVAYRSDSYRRLPFDNLDAIKSELAEGRPVIFGIAIDDKFYNLKKEVYDQTGGQTYGGHAMTLVGYDDSKRSPRGDKGAFKIINSWGKEWGDNGFGWISYRQWVVMRPYAYVMYPPRGTTTTPTNTSPTNTTPTNTTPAPAETVTTTVTTVQAPSRVQASQGTFPAQIDVAWSGVNGAVAYGVFRADPESDRFGFLGYSSGTAYSDRKVQAGMTYRYRVVSIGDEQTSELDRSPIASGYAKGGSDSSGNVPAAVTQVQARLQGRAGSFSVGVSWNAAPGAQFYQIRRWDVASNSWKVWGQKLTASTFSDPTPIPNTINRYAVRAGNAQGYGPWSDPVETTVPGTTTVPPTPGGLIVSNGIFREKISLRWDAVPGANHYYVFRYDNGSGRWDGPLDAGTSTTYNDQANVVRDGRFFLYSLVATNEAGASQPAAPVRGRVNPNAQRGETGIEAPTDIQAKIDASSNVTVTWKAVKGADEYYILRKPKGTKEYKFVGSTDGKTLQFSEKFPGKPGEFYLYTVRSKPGMGQESADGKPVAVFINAQVDAVAHRFMPGQGMDRFTGKWTGRYWDGKSAPRQITVAIEGDGDRMRIKLSDDRGGSASATGSYPAMADEVRIKGLQVVYKESLDLLILKGDEDFGFLPGQTISLMR